MKTTRHATSLGILDSASEITLESLEALTLRMKEAGWCALAFSAGYEGEGVECDALRLETDEEEATRIQNREKADARFLAGAEGRLRCQAEKLGFDLVKK